MSNATCRWQAPMAGVTCRRCVPHPTFLFYYFSNFFSILFFLVSFIFYFFSFFEKTFFIFFNLIQSLLNCQSSHTQGLDVIESTSFKHFTKEMISESYALKGTLFSQIGKYVEDF